MRSSLFSPLAAASTVSAISNRCANHDIADLVRKSTCGSSKAISRCIEQVDVFRLEEISPCFILNGCEKDDAVWFMQECNMPNSKQELRKRATSTDKDTTTDKTADKTTAKSSATSKGSSTTAPSSTAASTTKDSSTSMTASSTTASLTSSTSDSISSTASSSTTGSSSQSLVCSTTHTITTSACSTSGKSSSCTPTTIASATCASGMLCFPTLGANACVALDTPLTTSGIVVAVGFGIAVAGIILGLIIMSVKARSRAAADRREHELLLAGVGKKSAAGDMESTPYNMAGGVSESNLPLVTPGGPRSDYAGAQQEYTSQVVPQIQLHPGVGAPGQEESPHWSEDYNARR